MNFPCIGTAVESCLGPVTSRHLGMAAPRRAWALRGDGSAAIDEYRYFANNRYMTQNQALEALSALAHDTRLDAFRLLIKAAPSALPAGEISERLGVLQNTMSTHLGILERAGLIERHREGRAILCSADVEGMRALLTYLLDDCCQGKEAVCAPIFEALRCAC